MFVRHCWSQSFCWWLFPWFPRENADADYECGHDCPENPKLHLRHCGVLRRPTPLPAIVGRSAYQVLRSSSGSLAMFAVILRTSTPGFPRGLIHQSRHLLRLFFGVIAAVETFGAVFVEPNHNPMKLDHGTPSVSALAFGFGFGFVFGHVQSPRSKSGSLAIFTAIRRASSFVSNLAADRRPGSPSK